MAVGKSVLVTLACSILPSVFLCRNSGSQAQVIATYTVQVTTAPSGAEKALAPGFELVGGKRAITLGPMKKGMKQRAVAVNVGNYIILEVSR